MRYFLFVILLFVSTEASALSCARFEFNQDFIDKSEIIFEGKALNKISAKDIKKSKGNDVFLAPDMNKKDKYRIQVSKIWKGLAEEEQIEIEMNGYWGNNLNIGKETLIVAYTNKQGKYEIPLCGFYRETDPIAKERALLKKILSKQSMDKTDKKRTRVELEDVSDQTCSNDNECTIYRDICASCGCGFAVNRKHLKKYQDKSMEACNNKPPMMMCKMYCIPSKAKCQNNKCVF